MSKQILANELAEIITGLLINPVLMGNLDEQGPWQRFRDDIRKAMVLQADGLFVVPVKADRLANTIALALVDPAELGALDTIEANLDLMLALGDIVADYCGGQVDGTTDGDGCIDGEDAYQPGCRIQGIWRNHFLSVSLNDSLPSLSRNVWSAYDPDGWEDEIAADKNDDDELMTEIEIDVFRDNVRALSKNALLDSVLEVWHQQAA